MYVFQCYKWFWSCLPLYSSGAVWESRWTSWGVRPNEPSGFRGRKDLLNRASAQVTTDLSLICQLTSEDIKHQLIIIITSLNCCMSTLHLVHYTLLLTPACWKSNNTNARLMASALSLALDLTFGIHSHKTLDTAQTCRLLKPNWKPSSSHSISTLTNISTQFLLQSVYVCVFAVRLLLLLFNNTLCKLFW